jgi:hypothetical protein
MKVRIESGRGWLGGRNEAEKLTVQRQRVGLLNVRMLFISGKSILDSANKINNVVKGDVLSAMRRDVIERSEVEHGYEAA